MAKLIWQTNLIFWGAERLFPPFPAGGGGDVAEQGIRVFITPAELVIGCVRSRTILKSSEPIRREKE